MGKWFRNSIDRQGGSSARRKKPQLAQNVHVENNEETTDNTGCAGINREGSPEDSSTADSD